MNKKEKILTISNAKYPALLKEIYNPPRTLFYRGELKTLEKTCISIVGTRKYSDYGEMMTQKIVEELAVLDIAIVSGLAKGIDTIAHKAALQNKLPTIAVLGSGINNIYPAENLKLSKEIEKNGLILSEYEDLREPLPLHFPQRNRIVSGLSIATIVIEAPEKSGALITAKLALDQGREIFVVPGDIDRENTEGILRLLQNGGAYPISSGKDVIDVLRRQPHLFKMDFSKSTKPTKNTKKELPTPDYKLTPEQEKIFLSLPRRRKIGLEQIQKKTALPPEKILAALSILEIQGLISTKDGKYLRKC
jgi:DNA processing protein